MISLWVEAGKCFLDFINLNIEMRSIVNTISIDDQQHLRRFVVHLKNLGNSVRNGTILNQVQIVGFNFAGSKGPVIIQTVLRD